MNDTSVDRNLSAMSQPADAKTAALLSYDLAMLTTAHRYNIDDLADRTRSARELVRFFMELTKLSGADLFVEAGAKEASASRRAKELLPSARVVAFEANPYTYQVFASANASSGIEYLNLALNESPGPVTINVHRDEHGRPIANGQASLLQRDKDPKDRERGFHQVEIEGVTLDGFLGDRDYERAAVWVDVEGACRFVLSGGSKLLAKTAVALVEVEDASYWGPDHWLREQVVSYLYDLGLVPVARDFENVNQWSSQYNIVFVRADLLTGASRFRNELTRFRSRSYQPKRRKPVRKQAPATPPPPPAAPTMYSRLRGQAMRVVQTVQQRRANSRG